jgi:hypothetical protein
MPKTTGAAISLLVLLAHCASSQVFGDPPAGSEAQVVGIDCNTFGRVAMEFLNRRGMKVANDWSCGGGARCIVTKNAAPQKADGKALNRNEIVRDYLKESERTDIRTKFQGYGFWELPSRNFDMGARLRLEQKASGCDVKLSLNFGISYTQFLIILPFELYGDSFESNGRLEAEYIAAIQRELAR